MSDFIDGSDLYTLWLQEKILEESVVKLYVAELALTLGWSSERFVHEVKRYTVQHLRQWIVSTGS